MTPKVYIALFAFLALQGWTSARVIVEESSNTEIEVVPLGYVSDALFDVPGGVKPHGNPLNCVKYIEEAYNVAKEIRDVVMDTSTFVESVTKEVKKCINLDGFEENVVCLYELGKAQYPKGKELYDRIKVVKDKAKNIMEAFEKCMD